MTIADSCPNQGLGNRRLRGSKPLHEMIYSRQSDFLFVKGRKIGGTSMEIALSTLCGPEDIITPITPVDERERLRRGGRGAQNYSSSLAEERDYLEGIAGGRNAAKRTRSVHELYKNHMSLRDFIARYGSLPTRRIFGVERSPYAKIISMAVMAANFSRYRRTGEAMSLDMEDIRSVVSAQLKRGAVFETCRNIDLYRGPDGSIATRLLRQADLAAEFAGLMEEYGILPIPELPHAKQGINSNEIEPRDVFTRGQLDLINDVFAEEFQTFGYARA